MRNIYAAMAVVLLVACRSTPTAYETYVQANETTTADEASIVVVVKDSLSPESRPDHAMAMFVLSEGESATEVVRNRFYPKRKYTISVSREDVNVLTVQTTIEDSGDTLFHARQRFVSWAGF